MKNSKGFARTRFVGQIAAALALGLSAACVSVPAQAGGEAAAKPTIVLVHGAFVDSSSWDGVIARLQAHGYRTVAVANPLRSLDGDAAYVAGVVKSIDGPVVLVGHSYGGSVITDAATQDDNVKALVYVAAVAPDQGESTFGLIGKFPGSQVGSSLAAPVTLADGGKEFHPDPAKFRATFAADLPAARTRLLAVTERPVTEAALKAESSAPAWKSLPSWFVYGSADQSIPPALYAFMAERAHAKQTRVVAGASHLVALSHADAVDEVIEAAARTAR